MNTGGLVELIEREDDALICRMAGPGDLLSACLCRRPKLMSNEEWRPIANAIVSAINNQSNMKRIRSEALLEAAKLAESYILRNKDGSQTIKYRNHAFEEISDAIRARAEPTP